MLKKVILMWEGGVYVDVVIEMVCVYIDRVCGSFEMLDCVLCSRNLGIIV